MEEFKKKGKNIQILTTDKLSEEYSQMIKLHQNYLYKKIIAAIQHYIRGMRETEIETLIDRYLLTDIKYRGKQTIGKLNKDLQDAFIETINTIKNGDKNQLLKVYSEKINPPLRKNQMDWIPEITNQFSKQLMQKIDLYFVPFRETNDNIDRTLASLSKEINLIMEQYKNKFNEDYQEIYRHFLNDNKRQISDLINQMNLNITKLPNYQMYFVIANLSNYQLIEENGHIFAKDKNTEEKIELTFQEGLLSSKDGKIRYYIDAKNKRLGYANSETKTVIMIHNGMISLFPPKKNEQEKNVISFSKNGHKYQLYHNLKQIFDIDKIKFLLKELEQYAPGIYVKVMSDIDFGKFLVQIKNNSSNHKQNDQEIQSEEPLQESNSQEETSQNRKKH